MAFDATGFQNGLNILAEIHSSAGGRRQFLDGLESGCGGRHSHPLAQAQQAQEPTESHCVKRTGGMHARDYPREVGIRQVLRVKWATGILTHSRDGTPQLPTKKRLGH